jgi:hypothetical protein
MADLGLADFPIIKKLDLHAQVGSKTTPCSIEVRRNVFSHILKKPLNPGLTAQLRARLGQHTARP